MTGRLSTLAAALVIARRDFGAILFSRSFFFFLLGPLFPVIVGALAGGVGQRVQESAAQPELGVAMQAADVEAILSARDALAARLGSAVPKIAVVERLEPGAAFDSREALNAQTSRYGAILTGTPAKPVLTGTEERIAQWRGPVSMLAAQALGRAPENYPDVFLVGTATSAAKDRSKQLMTAQAAQTLLFLLTMLLAGMVLSNLVEEKGNKIIEILAAAIPMESVFFGKLFAMLAISLVGIAVWGMAGFGAVFVAGSALPDMTTPAVGWPVFLALGVIYFSMAYLLLGSLFLSIGSLATTVREVQTLSMPVTMMQLLVFFLASYAMTQPGSPIETFAITFPFSSPFAMIARAAREDVLWIHAAAIVWQVACVIAFVRIGARLFRTRVMKSGPSAVKRERRGPFTRIRPSAA